MKELDGESSRRGGIGLTGLLVQTFSIQALGTLAILIVPALAPIVARALEVPTSYVGYQVAMVYLAAMSGSICAGTVVGHFGPCRTGQIAMVINACGCLLASMPNASVVALGSIIIGGGYGLISPAASELLMRHAPADRRNLIFSVKQTGVPMGGMIAGLVGPTAAIAFGWQAVLWSAAGCSLVAAVALEPGRAVLDRHRGGSRSPRSLPFRALASVMTTPSLRWVALSSLCFSAIQMCVVAFLVVLLVEDLRYDLVTAGVILGVVQIGGALGRILWGYVADQLGDGLGVLLGIALIMTAAAAVVAIGAALPAWVPIATFIVLGVSAVGWNGVYMSEVARLSPAQSVGATTGASLFFTFAGVLIGPTLFSSVHAVIGSYIGSYVLLVGIGLLSAAMLTAVRFR